MTASTARLPAAPHQRASTARLVWGLAAAALAIIAVVSTTFPEEPADTSLLGRVAAWSTVASLAAIPVSVAIAVLRYRLYEIDRVISRTIGWIVVTTLLAAFVVGAFVGLQALLPPFTSNNTLAVAVSTLLAAALFQPLRARVQRVVDRRFNRARVDEQQAIFAFQAHLRDGLDLATLRGRLVSAAGGCVLPAGVNLWLRGGPGDAA